MEVALPVASIVSALVAIVLRRSPSGPGRQHEASTGTLALRSTQLVAVSVEGRDLVLDVFGGVGCWRTCSVAGPVDEASIVGTPMLTFRAAISPMIDAVALRRLQGWAATAAPLSVSADVDGDTPLAPPTRIVFDDGARSVTILAGE